MLIRMGKGGQAEFNTESCRRISWTEIRKHTSQKDKWIVIDDDVYDVSRWQYKHPGGVKVISHYAGQDASVRNIPPKLCAPTFTNQNTYLLLQEAFTAFHNDQKLVRKYLKAMRVGKLMEKPEKREQEIREDFANLRKTAEKLVFSLSVGS